MSWQLKNKGIGNGFKTGRSTGGSSSHHLETGDDVVRQFAASQIDTQKTTFMRWVNVQLAKTTAYGPMTSIEKDMKDGKRLIGLLEVISNEPLKPERGNMRIHQMANVSKALAFLEKSTDEAMGTIGNEDIVDGNVKLTLGLVWIIIYRFQIQHIANTMADLYPSLGVDSMVSLSPASSIYLYLHFHFHFVRFSVNMGTWGARNLILIAFKIRFTTSHTSTTALSLSLTLYLFSIFGTFRSTL